MPAEPRPAATLLLLRDGRRGLEVLLLRRHAGASFGADAWVFPGGVVDDGDRQPPPQAWDGIDPEALSERFAAPPDLVLGFHMAAVRETFEEAGILLAHGGAAPDPREAATLRARLAHGADDAFASWLAREGIVLDLSALVYAARWVTPTAERRRYDACFFYAQAPPEQQAAADRGETVGQRWVRPQDALDAHARGALRLMFPTVHALRDLVAARSAAAALRSARGQAEVRRLQPHAEVDESGHVIRIVHPDAPDFPAHLYA